MQNTLVRDSPTPLHSQIADALRLQIQFDEIKAGENFPSERELAEHYGVSRMTVRQALTPLRKEGLIYHERGVGTFVADRKIDVHTRNLGGFSEEMRRRGLEPSSKILSLRRRNADAQTAENLRIETDAEVFELERLRLADAIPLAYEKAFLPVALCPTLDDYNLEKLSLYDVLENRFNVEIHHAEEFLEAAVCAPREAKILGIKSKSPLLVVSRVVFTETNQAVESVQTLYRADRYRATFYLTKNAV